jgi:hypothetical protein
VHAVQSVGRVENDLQKPESQLAQSESVAVVQVSVTAQCATSVQARHVESTGYRYVFGPHCVHCESLAFVHVAASQSGGKGQSTHVSAETPGVPATR